MTWFPKLINIFVYESISKQPISNIAISITLFANRKNDYYFILPLSDKIGCIEITREWLIKEIKQEANIFIMDYASNLDDCKPLIEISVLSEDDLERTTNAMYLFQNATGITDDEIRAYERADNKKYIPYTKKS
jgi:hypothetical protein